MGIITVEIIMLIVGLCGSLLTVVLGFRKIGEAGKEAAVWRNSVEKDNEMIFTFAYPYMFVCA